MDKHDLEAEEETSDAYTLFSELAQVLFMLLDPFIVKITLVLFVLLQNLLVDIF